MRLLDLIPIASFVVMFAAPIVVGWVVDWFTCDRP